jgi:CHAD domain-containing protein
MSALIPLRSLHPEMPFAAAAREVLAAHLATLQMWSAFLPQAERAHEHHQMRIAAKRLRYSLDACEPLMPDIAGHCVPLLKNIQTELGTLHDLDVMSQSISSALAAVQIDHQGKRGEAAHARARQQQASLEALLHATATDREQQHRRCLALWQEIVGHDVFATLQTAIQALQHITDSSSAPDESHTIKEFPL